MTENALKQRLLKRLRALGGVWTPIWGGPYAVSGVSDIIGCYNGRYVAIELKAPGRYKPVTEGLRPAQRNFLDNITYEGGIAIVADDIDTVFDILNKAFPQ